MSSNPFEVIDKRLRNIEFMLQEVVMTNQVPAASPATTPAPTPLQVDDNRS